MTKRSIRLPVLSRSLIFSLIDFFWCSVALLISFALLFPDSGLYANNSGMLLTILSFTTGYVVTLILIYGYSQASYSRFEYHVKTVSKAVVIDLVLVGFFLALLRGDLFSWKLIITVAASVLILVLGGRLLVATFLQSSHWQRPVVIVGAGRAGMTIVREMRLRPSYGYRPVAFVDDDPEKRDRTIAGIPVLGLNQELVEVVRKTGAQLVVLAIDFKISSTTMKKLQEIRREGITVFRMADIYEILSQRVPVQHIPDSWVIEFVAVINRRTTRWNLLFRIFDLVGSITLGIISLPVALIAAVAIRIIDGSPILFVQERVGKDEERFRLYKFRTMRSAGSQETEGSINDSWSQRITPLGKLLRAARIDEVPQLINVFRGDVRLVGPRPFIPQEVEELSQLIPYYSLRFLVPPGITGHAQVSTAYENKPKVALRKLEYDLFYIKHQSIMFELEIIMRTIIAVIARKGR